MNVMTREGAVAYCAAKSPPPRRMDEATQQRLTEYFDRRVDEMDAGTYQFLCATADMFLVAHVPTPPHLTAFALAFTMHAQCNVLPV